MMDLVNRLSRSRLMIVGDLMLDRYWWGNVTRISPEAPVPVVHLSNTTEILGGACNVAANVVGLGAKATLFGVCGTDYEAEVLRGLANNAGICCDGIHDLSSRPTTVKTRVMAHGQQIARIDNETKDEIDNETEQRLIESATADLAACDAVIISDYAKGLLTKRFLKQLIAKCREMEKPVLVDPKGKDFTIYGGATVITPNRKEAIEACGKEDGTRDVVERAGLELIETTPTQAVLITRGEEGMSLFRKGHEVKHISTSARRVYDVTGAGDTVIATLGAAMGSGVEIETAARIANVAAGIVVEQLGTTRIISEELRERWEREHRADGSSA